MDCTHDSWFWPTLENTLLRSGHFQQQIEEELGRIQIKVEITFVLIEPFQKKIIFSSSQVFWIEFWYFQSSKNFFEFPAKMTFLQI